MQLQKATRKKVKLRLGLSGASGFGKTYSALLIAKGLVVDWSKIAVIDTENDSASLYSHLGDFNTLSLSQPFAPERYIEAINACVKAGMEVIIVDSISHEWDGKGGCLQIVESLGGKYQDWGKVTPRHQAFIDAITHSPVHMITTVRRKQDYEMTKDNNGKMKVEKAGLKEVTRDGWEYELTLNLELINDQHLAKASKDRTGLFMNKAEFVITEETGELIKAWTESGAEPSDNWKEKIDACLTQKDLVALYNRNKVDVDISPRLQKLISDRRAEINAATINAPTKEERGLLLSLVNVSDLQDDEKAEMFEKINTCTDYPTFQKLQFELEDRRQAFSNIQNPSASDIKHHVASIAR